MEYFQYSIKEDTRAIILKEILEDNEDLLKFYTLLLEMADVYMKELYDLSDQSDIESDEPLEPSDYPSSNEDDY